MLNIDYLIDYILNNPDATLRVIVEDTYEVYEQYMKEDEYLTLVAMVIKNLEKQD